MLYNVSYVGPANSTFTVSAPSLGDTPYMKEIKLGSGQTASIKGCITDWEYFNTIAQMKGVSVNYNNGTEHTINNNTPSPFGNSRIIRHVTGTHVEVSVPATDWAEMNNAVCGDGSVAFLDNGWYFYAWNGQWLNLHPALGTTVGYSFLSASFNVSDPAAINNINWTLYNNVKGVDQTIPAVNLNNNLVAYCYDARYSQPSDLLVDNAWTNCNWAASNTQVTQVGNLCNVMFTNENWSGNHNFFMGSYNHVNGYFACIDSTSSVNWSTFNWNSCVDYWNGEEVEINIEGYSNVPQIDFAWNGVQPTNLNIQYNDGNYQYVHTGDYQYLYNYTYNGRDYACCRISHIDRNTNVDSIIIY